MAARTRAIDTHQQDLSEAAPVDALDGDFGAEFRELARQRRFVRSDADAQPVDWRTEAAPPRRARREAAPEAVAAPAPSQPPAAATPELAPAASAPALPASLAPAALTPPATSPVPSPTAARMRAPRISEDQRATLLELARMSDRLVEARESLAAATTRAAHLEQELGTARQDIAAANDRLMASRVLVQDAQRATRDLAERCTWLEGRCEMLQEALELAVNASFTTRWRWRRAQRRRAAD